MENQRFDVQENENKKKRFCIWSFLFSLVVVLVEMTTFIYEIPTYVMMVIAFSIIIALRKKYKMWPNFIILIPFLFMMIFFSVTIRISQGYIIK